MTDKTHTINLSETDMQGRFPCPKGHQTIDPDDYTKEAYIVEDAKVDQYILIRCLKCQAKIKLNLELEY